MVFESGMRGTQGIRSIDGLNDPPKPRQYVMPAKAGIHVLQALVCVKTWIPALAGTTLGAAGVLGSAPLG
jgi:hypothetical protein